MNLSVGWIAELLWDEQFGVDSANSFAF
jgi:hypothetical protein